MQAGRTVALRAGMLTSQAARKLLRLISIGEFDAS